MGIPEGGVISTFATAAFKTSHHPGADNNKAKQNAKHAITTAE